MSFSLKVSHIKVFNKAISIQQYMSYLILYKNMCHIFYYTRDGSTKVSPFELV
jgi:hypothetical protein